ncbi:MAG TPA: acetyl-CoA carboxylase biotin carboxylase subunit [Thermomicrobiales bacterium]|nr:acetyl-CoA carboxylase biotin carboxylase subunit [Thermomicrobiales bacterium]
MFKKILIANRGEIALRILRACRDLRIPAVVAYSDVDHDSLPVRLADEAVCIGPAPAARSYNNIPAVISAALVTGCDAVHPGYGFLAENAYLAEICQQVGLTFIGPSPEVIEKMGNKAQARSVMKAAGVPMLPGTGIVATLGQAREAAHEIGFPVVIKAVAGGGGRGMRVAYNDTELNRGFPVAQAEAESAFGNGDVYVERFLSRPRHVEVQVLGDNHGTVLAIGERDCSLQRRHQKVVEEAPAPNLPRRVRDNLLKTAQKGAKAAGYTSAGTLEFLLDTDGRFYFMEMNTRIQVEHPVSEEISSLDLVGWQIRIAAGEKLDIRSEQLQPRGHSIECRITAEDAANDFRPSVGTVDTYVAPGGPGVRMDSHLFSGYTIPPNYDSLLGKVITWGTTREEAVARMERALRETVLTGVTHTIPFHREILADDAFQRGDVHTGFIPELMERIGTRLKDEAEADAIPLRAPTGRTSG